MILELCISRVFLSTPSFSTINHQSLSFADRRRYRDSYIYSDRYVSEIGGLSDTLGGLRGYLAKTSADQRVSVISNTSSNTTSGIVSDRVLSLDGSEGKVALALASLFHLIGFTVYRPILRGAEVSL